MQTDGVSYSDKLMVIMDMIMAGVDTTGNTLGFLLHNLAMNPEVSDWEIGISRKTNYIARKN